MHGFCMLLTSVQESAEVRALQRGLCFYISGYVFLQFVVYASLILDTLHFHASQDFNSIDLIAPDKATKQSRDLKCVFVFPNLHSFHISKYRVKKILSSKNQSECTYYLDNEIPDRLHNIHLMPLRGPCRAKIQKS